MLGTWLVFYHPSASGKSDTYDLMRLCQDSLMLCG